MKREFVKDIYAAPATYGDKTVTVGGWIRNIRDSKAFGFIDLNDGSCFTGIQIVFERDRLSNYDEIAAQNVGAALVVTGVVTLTPGAKQPLEIKADKIEVEGASTPDYPLQPKRHTVEYLREQAYLRPRTNLFSAVFRVRSEVAYAIHSFFHSRGFVYVHTPLITGSDCEGEGETYAMAYGKIYTFGPTFRAENSNTARHAAEFWMIEPEIAFADLNDDMQLAWDMIKYIINHVLENCAAELEFFNKFVDKTLLDRLNALKNADYVKVTYTEAVDLLMKSGREFKYPVSWGVDLQTEHERYLTEEIYKKPVFLIDYPKDIKAFYMRLNDDGKTVAAMDLLVPGVGEIIGGSQREERIDVLTARMKELGLKEEDYWWYLNLRRYGGTKHAGFGLGFERIIMYITGVANIRDVIPYPRTVGNAEY